MKYSIKKEKQVLAIIKKHRLIKNRVQELVKRGFYVKYCPVAVGGTGHIHKLVSEWRMQVGYAKGGGRENYAEAVIFEPSIINPEKH